MTGTVNIGNLMLWGALVLSILSLFFTAKSASGNKLYLTSARRIYCLSALLIFFAFVMLLVYFLGDDFRYAYVYQNSSSGMSVPYKTAALWAGREGSFLLWLLFLCIAGIAVIKTEKDFQNIVLGIVIITQIFILLLLVAESPFRFIWDVYPKDFQGHRSLPQGFDGMGMNPLLMDPWMITHPPLLFLGYASSAVPFGYAVAAVLKADYRSGLDRSYRWVLFSMTTLGIGIFLGGYWAYKVLGWGGFWGWDPVENSSLIPWLVAVALMHIMLIQKRKGSFIKTGLALAMLYPTLVFYSTFLTRSGVLSDFSVHSFGSGGISGYIVFFILFYLIIGIFLFAKSFSSAKGTTQEDKLWSWDGLTLYGALTLIIFGLIILVGTSMPIVSGIFGKNAANVTEHFYNSLSVPFGIMIIVFMALSIIATQGAACKKSAVITAALIAVCLSAALNISQNAPFTAWIFTALALFVVIQHAADLAALKNKRRILSSRLAHCGVGIFILGCVAAGFYTESFRANLEQGSAQQVGPVTLTFQGFNKGEKSSLSFEMEGGMGKKSFSCPYYITESNTLYREPYIYGNLLNDIYITAEEYVSGKEALAQAVFAQGETKALSGTSIRFNRLYAEGMMSNEPAVFAELTVNEKNINPGVRLKGGHKHPIPAYIPNTQRKVLLDGFDLKDKIVKLIVEPEQNANAPADRVIVELSVKRLIWLVWAGTALIAIGGLFGLLRKTKKGAKA